MVLYIYAPLLPLCTRRVGLGDKEVPEKVLGFNDLHAEVEIWAPLQLYTVGKETRNWKTHLRCEVVSETYMSICNSQFTSINLPNNSL